MMEPPCSADGSAEAFGVINSCDLISSLNPVALRRTGYKVLSRISTLLSGEYVM
jgi:hypothetical protein